MYSFDAFFLYHGFESELPWSVNGFRGRSVTPWVFSLLLLDTSLPLSYWSNRGVGVIHLPQCICSSYRISQHLPNQRCLPSPEEARRNCLVNWSELMQKRHQVGRVTQAATTAVFTRSTSCWSFFFFFFFFVFVVCQEQLTSVTWNRFGELHSWM